MDAKFKWASFKDRTNITGRRRGSNMKEVDEALQAYWDEVAGAPTNQKRQMYAAFTLLKACNSWLKLKKDKNTKMSVPGAKQNEHFKTRWDAVKDLAKAAFAETYKLQADPNKPLGVVEYERKKMLAASAPAKTTKALSGGYATERAMWLGSKKQANPVSGTTLHETMDALTNQDAMAYDANLAALYGGEKVLRKDFDQMSIKDWQAIEKLMVKIEATQGPMKKHVVFLKKAERIKYIAIVVGGKLTKIDGTLWDTGTWELPFAVDSYGNLFIGEDSIVTPSDRLNHSSLLAGKEVLCAGTLKISNGMLTKFNNNSGHYKPTGTNVYEALLALQAEHVDLSQTVVTIMTSQQHGFDGLTVAEVIAAQGQFAAGHPKAY